jgi:hypothetical protein
MQDNFPILQGSAICLQSTLQMRQIRNEDTYVTRPTTCKEAVGRVTLRCVESCRQICAAPPSTKSSMPLTKLESLEARNRATVAISSGRPSSFLLDRPLVTSASVLTKIDLFHYTLANNRAE